jgi:hypothetical protein
VKSKGEPGHDEAKRMGKNVASRFDHLVDIMIAYLRQQIRMTQAGNNDVQYSRVFANKKNLAASTRLFSEMPAKVW